jgi:hypothetical protein
MIKSDRRKYEARGPGIARESDREQPDRRNRERSAG